MREFLDHLCEAFRSALEPYVKPYVQQGVYRDRERMCAGYRFDEELGRAICESASWLVVYSPAYRGQEYCLRELAAMQQLEDERRRILGTQLKPEEGMIIPIILRGGHEQLPESIRRYHHLDFRSWTTASGQILRNARYVREIDHVAEYISRLVGLGQQLEGAHCEDFVLPRGSGRSPFPNLRPQPLPGRWLS